MNCKLTEEHIEAGVPEESDECAVALCLDDAGLVASSVMDTHDQLEKGGYELHATFEGFRCFQPAPSEVEAFVKLFDDESLRVDAKPFSFEVDESKWAAGFCCKKCGARVAVALSRLRRLAKLAQMADRAEVVVSETCSACNHRGKAVFREGMEIDENGDVEV